MNILITGNCGFIGEKVFKKIEEKKHNVFGYNISNKQDLFDLKKLEEYIKK